jgi:hypothetical protein
MAAIAAEVLEARWLLSNVAVNLAGDSLSLQGDADNHRAMVFIVGDNLHFHGENGTEFTFEGTTSSELDIPLSRLGSLQNVYITSRAGDDHFELDLTGFSPLAGGITVALGAGHNGFVLRDAVARQGVWYSGGQATDEVLIDRCTVGGLNVNTLGGDDMVTVSSCNFEAKSLNGFFDELRAGYDPNKFVAPLMGIGNLVLAGLGLAPVAPPMLPQLPKLPAIPLPNAGLPDVALTGGEFWVDTSSGNDTVIIENTTGVKPLLGGIWNVLLGDGNDNLSVDGSAVKSALLVDGSAGNDTVTVKSTTLDGFANIAGSTGTDKVALEGVTAAAPLFVSALGNDSRVEVEESTFQSLVAVALWGERSQLLVETTNGPAPANGTRFQMPVLAVAPGKGSAVNLGATAGDPLFVASFFTVVGGVPSLPVNVAAGTQVDADKLLLILAERHNV